jgi:protein gp37
MADHSKIQWTEASWPVTTGCTEVSAGCDLCYAARLTSGRLKHLPEYAGLAVDGKFTGEVRCHPGRLDWPLRWRKPRRIFVCSMSDLFHKDVPDEFIARVWSTMYGSPRHTFQVLTKRHGRLRSWLRRCARWDDYITHNGSPPSSYGGDGVIVGVPERWPLPNVWCGVSVEDQHWADIRIPALLATPAAVRWLSCEPLLGPVDLGIDDPHAGHEYDEVAAYEYVCLTCSSADDLDNHRGVRYFRRDPGGYGIDWVVCGGESGPGARPMHPDWARSLRDQCVRAETPFFFKQWGEYAPVMVATQGTGWEPRETTERVGKKAAGRELDGRTWDEYPVVSDAS